MIQSRGLPISFETRKMRNHLPNLDSGIVLLAAY